MRTSLTPSRKRAPLHGRVSSVDASTETILSVFDDETKFPTSAFSSKRKPSKRRITFSDARVTPVLHSPGFPLPPSSSSRRSSSLKSIGPVGWKSARMKRRSAVVAGSPHLLFRNVDETVAADVDIGPVGTNPNLSKEIRKLRNKRKHKIRTYWNKVLEVMQDVEMERRTHRSHLIDEAHYSHKQTRKKSPKRKRVSITKNEHYNDNHDEDEDDDDDYDSDNPWKAENIGKEANFTQWLLRARGTLPSVRGELQNTTILEGKFYRQFKAAGERVYAKCALLDDDDEREGDFVEHMKEAADPQNTKYRKKFNYFDHLSSVKAFPTTLNKKRLMYRYLNEEAEEFGKTESECKVRCYPRLYRLYLAVASVMNDITPMCRLWKIPIHALYAYFGSEVFNYFVWLRKIFFIEVLFLVVVLIFMVLPGAYEIGGFGNNTTQPFNMMDFLHGAGWFETSLWYYGGYPAGKSIQLDNLLQSGMYRLGLVWILLCMIKFCMIVFGIAVTYSQYAEIVKESHQSLSHFNTVFCSWEFSVNSVQLSASVQDLIGKNFSHLNTQSAAADDSKYYNYDHPEGLELKQFLAKRKGDRGLKIFHAFVNIVTLLMAITSSCVLYFIIQLKTTNRNEFINHIMLRFLSQLNYDDSMTFFVSGLYFSILFNLMSPIIVFLSDIELWEKRRQRNYYVIGRLSFIYLANYLIITSYFLFLSTQWHKKQEKCFETVMGIFLYQAILWEFVFSLSYCLIKDVLLNFILWKCSIEYTAPEPSMDILLTSLFFRHALVNLVVQFAPIVCILSLVTTVITYYVKKTILYWIFSHPKFFAHVSDFELPYFLCSYIFYCVQLVCNLHIATRGQPSRSCGALRRNGSETDFPYYISFTNMLQEHYKVNYIAYRMLQDPTIGFTFFALICGAVFIMKSWGQAYKLTVDTNRSYLQLERKDRAFLLRAIYDYSKYEDGETSANTKKKNQGLIPDITGDDEDVSLELNRKNVIQTKVRSVGALMVAGKRNRLAKQYDETKAIRGRLIKEFEANRPANESNNEKLKRLYELREELASDVLTPTKEAVEARRQSMATKFMMTTEAIKLSLKEERLQKQRLWRLQGRIQSMDKIGRASK